MCLVAPGCQIVGGPAGGPPGTVGAGVADEPRAALIGRSILTDGGNAVDAAVAMALAMAVTLPSRVGFGGGGHCLVHVPSDDAGLQPWSPTDEERDARAGRVTVGGDPADNDPGDADRRVAISGVESLVFPVTAAGPGFLRGLAVLHAAGGGKLRWARVIAPAESLARTGVRVSRALARDLAAAAGGLIADPELAALFLPDGVPLGEGMRLVQPALAATLVKVRLTGAGALHNGVPARRLAEAYGTSQAAVEGYPVDRRAAAAAPSGNEQVHFGAIAPARAAAAAAAWRRDPGAAAAARGAATGGLFAPRAPYEAGLAVTDGDDRAVACLFSMGGLFGRGRLIADTGIIAAAPATADPPGLVALSVNPAIDHVLFAASAAGSAPPAAAPLARLVAAARRAIDEGADAVAALADTPDPTGRVRLNLYACDYDRQRVRSRRCAAAADPAGHGLAFRR